MQIAVLSDEKDIAAVGAEIVIRALRDSQRKVIGLATGSSPLPLYDALVEQVEAGRVSFDDVRAFCLDEYVGLPADHPEAYRNYIRRVFTDRAGFADANVHAPDGASDDPIAAAARYDAEIEAAGGVDIQILGIGSDGHIGFNEPGGSLTSRTHVGALTTQTRSDNARFFAGKIEKVPQACITQGLGTIMDAREIVMVATGAGKAKAIRQLVEGSVSGRWPATILQFHDRVTILLDEAAASQLELRDHYAEAWKAHAERQGV